MGRLREREPVAVDEPTARAQARGGRSAGFENASWRAARRRLGGGERGGAKQGGLGYSLRGRRVARTPVGRLPRRDACRGAGRAAPVSRGVAKTPGVPPSVGLRPGPEADRRAARHPGFGGPLARAQAQGSDPHRGHRAPAPRLATGPPARRATGSLRRQRRSRDRGGAARGGRSAPIAGPRRLEIRQYRRNCSRIPGGARRARASGARRALGRTLRVHDRSWRAFRTGYPSRRRNPRIPSRCGWPLLRSHGIGFVHPSRRRRRCGCRRAGRAALSLTHRKCPPPSRPSSRI